MNFLRKIGLDCVQDSGRKEVLARGRRSSEKNKTEELKTMNDGDGQKTKSTQISERVS